MKDPVEAQRAHALAEALCRSFLDHGYAVGRDEAKSLGVKLPKDDDLVVLDLIWKAWLDFESELQVRVKYSPISELMASPEGAKLTRPVPQVTIPPGTPPDVASAAFENAIEVVSVNPVDSEYVVAVVESTRLASRNVEKTKILGCRTPDLDIRWSTIVVWSGWKRIEPDLQDKGKQS